MGVDFDACGLNRACLNYPLAYRYLFSFHADEVRQWVPNGSHVEVWSHHKYPSVNHVKLPIRVSGGGSAVPAIYAALLKWGYHKIVLAGVPLSGPYKDLFFPSFQRLYRELSPAVRSLSGNTLDLFGPPTKEWLNDIC
ncbi:conserved protein of unknown function [Pseudodesulfovibrio profundus]|uniref:Uncharacterized protein n=2 Tax=Pseudodesulfovibrio profundus TaxID=57320 RepID=A0A2C8FF02_9BACT|nr:conserved protein of unknown function [Pseudodesulfovibrio profundus]